MRRAQGASLEQGCIYFDQHRHHAGRGYGYVAVSRFKTRARCYLYGKLRRTDFLPVGEELETEVLLRGDESESCSDSEGIESAFGEDADSDASQDDEYGAALITDDSASDASGMDEGPESDNEARVSGMDGEYSALVSNDFQ